MVSGEEVLITLISSLSSGQTELLTRCLEPWLRCLYEAHAHVVKINNKLWSFCSFLLASSAVSRHPTLSSIFFLMSVTWAGAGSKEDPVGTCSGSWAATASRVMGHQLSYGNSFPAASLFLWGQGNGTLHRVQVPSTRSPRQVDVLASLERALNTDLTSRLYQD